MILAEPNPRSLRTALVVVTTVVVVSFGGLVFRSAVAGDVLISELMAVNDTVLADEDGEYSDWVELYNPGDEPVDLEGWHLTDTFRDAPRWQFPAVVVPPKAFLTVFCSRKNRIDPSLPLHTNFRLGGGGEYLALVRPDGATVSWQFAPRFKRQLEDVSFGYPQTSTAVPFVVAGAAGRALVPADDGLGTNWTVVDFDDSNWIPGASAFGFDQKNRPTYDDLIETDIGEEMRRISATAYIRLPFVVDDPASFDLLQLRVKFEDGFIAYLNGDEVARRNAPEDATWDSRAAGRQSTTQATTFEVFDLTGRLGLLRPGENLLAIHGLNDSPTSSDFFVLGELTGLRVDDLDLGRPQYFTDPTPGWPNAASGKDEISRPPRFSSPGRAVSPGETVEILSPVPGVPIRYTLDGSEPTVDSPLYEGPISLTSTVELKAKVFEPDRLPSPTASESYLMIDQSLLGFTSDLPLVVVDTFGLGINGSRNVPMHFLVVDVGESGRTSLTDPPDYSGRAGIKTRGSSTGNRAKASFSVEIWDSEDDDRDVALLGLEEDSDWILYGPYNFDRALIRNPFVYELSNQIGRWAVRTRFVELFVNRNGGPVRGPVPGGSYFGVYVLMEKISRAPHRVDIEKLEPTVVDLPEVSGGYILKIDRQDPGDTGFSGGGQTVLYVDPKEVDIERRPAQMSFLKQYFDTFNGSLSRPLGDPEGYGKYIDVDSWIDHHIINEFTKNPDGFRLSTYMFKRRDRKLEAGPVWDFDRTLGPDDDARAANPVGPSNPRTFGWWGRLLQDREFRSRYSKRWRQLRKGPMSTENLHAIIDGMAAELVEAQERNFRKWPLALGLGGWQGKVSALKSWVQRRVEWMDVDLLDAPDFSRAGGMITAPFELEISSDVAGDIYYTLDGSDPRLSSGVPGPSAQLYTDAVVLLENTRVRARVRVVNNVWSPLGEAVFVVSLPPLAITEIMYSPQGGTDFEFVEIYNAGVDSIDLAGSSFSRGVGFDFSDAVLGPGEYAVVVRDLDAFSSRYDTAGIFVAGEYTGSLSDRGEVLELSGPATESIVGFRYRESWHPETDGTGHSLVLLDPTAAFETLEDAALWRPSTERGGSPGRADPTEPAGSGQRPGDLDQNGKVNIADSIGLLRFLFQGATPTLPCADGRPTDAANLLLLDATGDFAIDTADVLLHLAYLFLDGPPPSLGTGCREIPGCPEVCSTP